MRRWIPFMAMALALVLWGCTMRSAGSGGVGNMRDESAAQGYSHGVQGVPPPGADPGGSTERAVVRPGEELWIIARDRKRPEASAPSSDDIPRTVNQLRPRSGALVCRTDGGFVPVPLRHTEVDARIDGIVSSVSVSQQFHNPFAGKIEAHYVFPLPENAGVTGFTMTVGERRIRAIIRERKDAERIYKAARAVGAVAALLSQFRPNVFRQKVANIEPGRRIDVDITYWHTVKRRDGWFEWTFPMVVGPRYNPAYTSDGVGTAGTSPRSEGGQPVDVHYLRPGRRSRHDIAVTVQLDTRVRLADVQSPTHDINTWREGEGRARITLGWADRERIPNKDLVLRWRLDPESMRAAAFTATRDGQEGGHCLLMIEPPAGWKSSRALDLVFLLDCSGSMKGEPLEQMIDATSTALDMLTPEDTFQVVRFSSRAAVLGTGPVAATARNKLDVKRKLRALEAEGGTEMMRGLNAALALPEAEGRQRYYVLMTDGFIGNERDVLSRVARKLGDARIFSFGIGSSPNRFLLERLARVGAGAAAYVGSGDEAGTTMSLFMDRVRSPVLTGVQIDWGGLQAVDVQPSRLPDLLPGRALVVSARFKGRSEGPIKLRGLQGGVMRELEIPVAMTDPARSNPDLARLWARARIADVQEQAWCGLIGRRQADDLTRRLALDYGLLSRHTSFVAVDPRTRTAGDHGTTVPVPVPVPAGSTYDTTGRER